VGGKGVDLHASAPELRMAGMVPMDRHQMADLSLIVAEGSCLRALVAGTHLLFGAPSHRTSDTVWFLGLHDQLSDPLGLQQYKESGVVQDRPSPGRNETVRKCTPWRTSPSSSHPSHGRVDEGGLRRLRNEWYAGVSAADPPTFQGKEARAVHTIGWDSLCSRDWVSALTVALVTLLTFVSRRMSYIGLFRSRCGCECGSYQSRMAVAWKCRSRVIKALPSVAFWKPCSG
jgi:hypothetical protein